MDIEIRTYRKRPVEIEAALFVGGNETAGKILAHWCGGNYLPKVTLEGGEIDPVPEAITIPTLEGTMIANVGDYIICGVQGEFYPCKPDIFQKTYERV